MENLRTTISGNLTKNDHVLIVGGSRGIGELTAKLVSLGGARVTITYARGENEAQSVAREIKSTGGKCDVMRLDVSESIAEQMSLPSSPFTHCYYFATPPIFRKRGLAFDRTTLDSFITFYIEAFHELSELLLSRNPQARIFTPSTSAIDERPAGSLEYVTSKLGTERLAEDMSRRHPKARIITSRFPRILTDQTATVLPVRSEDPLSILVPLIHSLHEK
nr:SDR family NAD(P)-dependent oxidoreductase [Sphingomonas sp. dw_22]